MLLQTTRCRELNKHPYFHSLKTVLVFQHKQRLKPDVKTNKMDLHPAISSGDFGRVIKLKSERNLTDNEKYVLLIKHFIPAASYKFPCHSINGQKRSFQHSWLSKYNGLVYSESQDGGYCKFCVLFGDRVLEEHLKNSASNALYTSKTVQNELIVICGDIIRNKILAKVRQAKYFSIIADEATDVANDEQLSICIRYVEEGVPQEKFIAFHECVSGVTGEAISENISSQTLRSGSYSHTYFVDRLMMVLEQCLDYLRV